MSIVTHYVLHYVLHYICTKNMKIWFCWEHSSITRLPTLTKKDEIFRFSCYSQIKRTNAHRKCTIIYAVNGRIFGSFLLFCSASFVTKLYSLPFLTLGSNFHCFMADVCRYRPTSSLPGTRSSQIMYIGIHSANILHSSRNCQNWQKIL